MQPWPVVCGNKHCRIAKLLLLQDNLHFTADMQVSEYPDFDPGYDVNYVLFGLTGEEAANRTVNGKLFDEYVILHTNLLCFSKPSLND